MAGDCGMGILVFAVSLAMLWPHANARYFVPVTYLLLIGIWKSTRHVAQRWAGLARWMNGGLIAFLIGFLLCNGSLYGVELYAQRSHDFYGTYEAGLDKDLIAAASWLDAHHLRRG